MRYATVCSGIEAPSVAWPTWQPVWFSEVNPFCRNLLKHHYPEVPNLGDMTKLYEKEEIKKPIDLLAGGTPCQSFSVAGLRGGLNDERGQLAMHFVRLCAVTRPK